MPPPHLCLLAAALLAAPAPAQQVLMVCDSVGDRVMLYDAFDGALVNEDFIVDMGGAPYGFTTPKEALQVGDEIWVVDQVEDALHRFDLAGQHLASIVTGLDNVRGGEFVGGVVYVTNYGTQNGAPGPSLLRFDPAGNALGSFSVNGTSPFDVVQFNGGLAVTDFARDTVDCYDLTGNFLGTLAGPATGTQLENPEQIARTAGQTVLVAAFGAPTGIFEYDASGNEVGFQATNTGLRGVFELGNGSLLYTASLGIFVLDPATGAVTDVSPSTPVSGQNVSVLDPTLGTTIGSSYCGPAVVNSSGASAAMSATGSALVAANNLTLVADGLPLNSFGFFLTSRQQGLVAQPGGSQGVLCLGGAIGRYVGPGQVRNSGPAGAIALALDLAQTPTPGGFVAVAPGESWSFTAWYRDSVGGSAASNFADGRELVFQ